MPFRSGFLHLSTEIWSQKYSVPCGMFTASLASLTPPQMPVASRYLQQPKIFPDTAKCPRGEQDQGDWGRAYCEVASIKWGRGCPQGDLKVTLIFFTPKLVLDDRRPWEVLVLKIITNSIRPLEPVESEWTWEEYQPLLEVLGEGQR